MKKITILLYILLNLWAYGYDYPYKNPYVATVLATMPEDMPEFDETNYKEIKMDLKRGTVPKNLWYLEDFKFGLMAQKEKAPLIFLFAGTGSRYNSDKMVTMSRILYKKGFSVIMLPTSFDYNYIVNVSETHAPGYLLKDSEEIYELMKIVLDKVNKKIKYDDIFVTGYSLGGTISLALGKIDSRENYFNFKKILAINPTVNLYESAIKLDHLLDDNIHSEEELEQLIKKIISGVIQFSNRKGTISIDKSSIYSLFKELHLKEEELETLIGLAFRFIAIDVNYITDIMTKSGVYTDPNKKTTKFQSMEEYYKAVNYSNFEDYIKRIGYTTYKKTDKTLTLEKMISQSSLEAISNYLEEANNIMVITNEDEIILTKENMEFLKKTMGGKIKVYPHGGHCGNMFYKENVEFMVDYFLGGDPK